MQDRDTQRELLKETVSSKKDLKVAIHMKMGVQKQQKISQNTNTTAQSVNAINNFQTRNCNANYQQSRNDFIRYSPVTPNYQYTSIFTNCGQRWSHNHRQTCPANGKKFNDCVISGHFARKCRRPKKSQTQTFKPPQTSVIQIDTTVERSDDEKSVSYFTSYQQPYDQIYEYNYESDSGEYVAAISCDSANQHEPLNAQIKFGSVQANTVIDSGSIVSLITKTLAIRILETSLSAK